MAALTVTLQDCPKATEFTKERAEQRFMKTLEASFPDSVAMLAAYKIWQDASEGGSGLTLSKADADKAKKFQAAFVKACQAGLQGLSPNEETLFNLRLA